MANLKEAFDIHTWCFKNRRTEGEPTMAIQADIGHGGWGHTCDYVLQSYPSQCLCGKTNPDDVKEFEKTFGSGHDEWGRTSAFKRPLAKEGVMGPCMLRAALPQGMVEMGVMGPRILQAALPQGMVEKGAMGEGRSPGHTEYIKDIRNVQNLRKRKKRDLRYGGQRNVPNDNQFS